MIFYSLLVLGHVLGSICGVLSATVAEMLYIKLGPSYRTDEVTYEKTHRMWSHTSILLRLSTLLTVLTGVGFVCYFAYTHDNEYLLSPMFWAKMAMVSMIGVNAYLLHTERISYYFGSALSFTSWWLALGAGFFLTNDANMFSGQPLLSFAATMTMYGAAVVVLAACLQALRTRSGITPGVRVEPKRA
ncbi:MAG: hypothetical protein RLZZ234_131 [Candidatus Parcubacteria bacterium]|jgi:uncharacterized membrane protein